LFGIDTGIYLVVALAFYCLLLWRHHPDGKPRLTARFLGGLLIGFFAVVGGGLVWASRGDCFQSKFWLGYLEAPLCYSGGFSALPMREGLARPVELVLALAMLTAYTVVIVNALDRFWAGHLTAAGLIQAQLGVFGLGALLLFVNRSDPFNLYHVTVPFCALLAAFLSNLPRGVPSEDRGQGASQQSAWAALPWIGVVVLLLALLGNPNFHAYPSWSVRLLKGSKVYARQSAPGLAQADRMEGPVAATLRELTRGGTRSVAVVYSNETPVLVRADLPPYFRYSPLLLFSQHQVSRIRQDFVQRPPEVVFLCRPALDREMSELWAELLREDYSLDARSEAWEVHQRRAKRRPP
jgi:hypothetical protein